jgi:hypothetical protein
LQQVFGTRALEGDVASGALVAKIIERRCTMLGLYTYSSAAKRQPGDWRLPPVS